MQALRTCFTAVLTVAFPLMGTHAMAALPPGKVVLYQYLGQPLTDGESFGWVNDSWQSLGIGPTTSEVRIGASVWMRDDLPPDTTVTLDAFNPLPGLVGMEVHGAGFSYPVQWDQPGTEIYRISLAMSLHTAHDGQVASWSIRGWAGSPNHHDTGTSSWNGSEGSDTVEHGLSDLGITGRGWNTMLPGVWSSSVVDSPVPLPAVPEPASAALLSAGCLMLWRHRRH